MLKKERKPIPPQVDGVATHPLHKQPQSTVPMTHAGNGTFVAVPHKAINEDGSGFLVERGAIPVITQ